VTQGVRRGRCSVSRVGRLINMEPGARECSGVGGRGGAGARCYLLEGARAGRFAVRNMVLFVWRNKGCVLTLGEGVGRWTLSRGAWGLQWRDSSRDVVDHTACSSGDRLYRSRVKSPSSHRTTHRWSRTSLLIDKDAVLVLLLLCLL
jgi:hypothetical protein